MAMLFDSAIKQNAARRLARIQKEMKSQKKIAASYSAPRHIPRVIAHLSKTDKQFDAYMKKAKKIKLPEDMSDGFCLSFEPKTERTGVILASFEFSEIRRNHFTGRDSDTAVEPVAVLVTQGKKQSVEMFVYGYSRSECCYSWKEANEYFDKKKVRRTMLDLANPKKTIATLFEFRAPKKTGYKV